MPDKECLLEERYGKYLERPVAMIATVDQAIEAWGATEDAGRRKQLIERAFELCATYDEARRLRGCTELGGEQMCRAQKMVIRLCTTPDQAYQELTDAQGASMTRQVHEVLEREVGSPPSATEPDDLSDLQTAVFAKVAELLTAAGF